ncbi:MAG: SRPBCC family protein [Pseudomonadota bacterium]
MAQLVEPVELTVTVAALPDRAFDLFQGRFGDWWPPEYTYCGQGGLTPAYICIGEAEGAMCSEIGPHGFRIDWGRTLTFHPGRHLVFLWQIGPDSTPQPNPDLASIVELRFAADGEATGVALTHRAFERHGDGVADYREEMAGEQGWPLLLERYRAFVAENP